MDRPGCAVPIKGLRDSSLWRDLLLFPNVDDELSEPPIVDIIKLAGLEKFKSSGGG